MQPSMSTSVFENMLIAIEGRLETVQTVRCLSDNVIHDNTSDGDIHIHVSDDVVHPTVSLRKLTKLRLSAGETIAEWWRVVVPCVVRLRTCRESSTRICNTWRMYVALFNAKTQLQHVKTIQAVMRRYAARLCYVQQRQSVCRLQLWYRSYTPVSKRRALLRHIQNMRCQHVQRVEELQTNLASTQNDVQELDDIVENSYLCLISRSPLQTPVFSRVDGQLYEKDDIQKWLQRNHISPLTREPMCLDDLLTCGQLQNTLTHRQLSSQCLHCDWCSRQFNRSEYHNSTNEMVRAYNQHVSSRHNR